LTPDDYLESIVSRIKDWTPQEARN